MDIIMKIKCRGESVNKIHGVVLVEKEEDIEPLWKLLCKQDDYWKHYKHLIKVAPKEIESEWELKRLCEYNGKTDIYKMDELKSKIDFMIFQYEKEED